MPSDDLEAVLEAIREQGCENKNQIESISKKMDDHKKEIIKTVNDKIDSCLRKVSRCEARVSDVETKVDNIVDKINRSRNLIINGIPYKNDEKLIEIMSIFSSKLGYEVPPDAFLIRFKGNDDNKRPILMKFPTEFHQQQFFHRYLKVAKGLKRMIFPAFAGDNERIYLQHDLCNNQYKIHKAALKLKSDGIIHQTKTSGGCVHIRFKEGETLTQFETPEAMQFEVEKRKKRKKTNS